VTEPDDPGLLERAREGDPAAFDEIVDRYERRVFAVALRIVRNNDDARDVTQEVFVTALRALKGFRGDAQLSTWFHRVTVNASLDLVRKRRRREHSSVDELTDQPAGEPGPEAEAIAAVRAREVHKALGALAPDQRALIVMHDLHDLDYAECAEALGIPLGTVKSRLHRARLALARQLGHLREGEPTGDHGPLRYE
jgi:RNA polymerase sigma-70 factor, ECF subfamily